MQIIQERSTEDLVSYRRVFRHVASGAAFAFPCDREGNILFGELTPIARVNAQLGLLGELDYHTDAGVVSTRQRVMHPRIGLCCCGCTVELDCFTNTCECGRDYNSAGQELAPREFWGEETGETYADLQDL